jgi:5-formyltetrahydrofolate cyclo-ligase
MSPLHVQKSELRTQVRAVLQRLTPAARSAASARLCAQCLDRPEWQQARAVLLFAPLPDEVDIWALVGQALASGKTVTLPRFSVVTQNYVAAAVRDPQTDLRRGKLGIREPEASCAEFPLNRLDLVLVPGVAFDPHGRRLGRGKGFYDRLLADMRGTTCGVAFDEQVVAEVPVGPRDVLLNCIVTPSRWLGC